MSEYELKPCPFCGSDCEIISPQGPLSGARLPRRTAYWVFCKNEECWAEGPLRNSAKTATTAWNTRAGGK